MTQLCAIPTCRIHGRHLPACQDDQCAGCLPRVAEEGVVCAACESRAERALAEIQRLVPDARAVAYGEVRRTGGGGSNKPGSRSPGNDDALDALQTIGNSLTTLAREIADVRGLTFGSDGAGSRLRASVAAQQPSLVPTHTPETAEGAVIAAEMGA